MSILRISLAESVRRSPGGGGRGWKNREVGCGVVGGELRDSLHSCFSRIVTSREGKPCSLLILQTPNRVLILENKDSDVSSILVGF